MRKIKNIIWMVFLGTLFFSCNDDFLEKYPLDAITNENFWNAEKDLKAYAYGFYNFDGEVFWDNHNSDDLASENPHSTATSQRTVDNGNWDWTYLRKCNFFIENHDNSTSLSQDIKNQYLGLGKFFRARYVYERIKTYGDIPFSTKVLTTEDKDVLFGKRVARAEVMKVVLEDLNDAVKYIPENRSEGEITKWAALALKARICLHEGTFRKYHGIAGEEEFLKQAADAAKNLIENGDFELYSTGKPDEDYRNLFIQKSLNGNKEAILHEIYDGTNKGHNFARYLPGPTLSGLTKDMVNDYLCNDGLPIGLSPNYKGDDSFDDEFADRDPRLLQTIVGQRIGFFKTQGQEDDIFPQLGIAKGVNSVAKSTTGYHFMKGYTDELAENDGAGDSDLFLFRYAEILLIYAEAKAELGEADQAVIDATINKLRERVGMTKMVIADLKRDPNSDMVSGAGYDVDVSVLIEEIRRERRIELACEGFRYDDLMRWKAGKFLEKQALGGKWSAFLKLKSLTGTDLYEASMVNDKVFLNAQGYINIYPNLKDRSFDPKKDYYSSIPLKEIVLNPNLEQNPGWPSVGADE